MIRRAHNRESETELQARIRLAVGRVPHARLFRNQVGDGWMGEVIAKDRDAIVLAHPRYVTMGLAPGSHDLIGWTTVLVTAAMIGMPIAVFTSGEIKRADVKAVRDGQEKWRIAVDGAGGFTAVLRSTDDALRLVRAGP